MKTRMPPTGPQRHGLSLHALSWLLALLVLPLLASLQLARSFEPWWLFGYLLTISLVAFWLNWQDKRSAQAGQWRTPESTLHLIELLGGWPGAFLAQRVFRHKIAKTPYQIAFWSIVILHEVIAADFLCEWHYAKFAIGLSGR